MLLCVGCWCQRLKGQDLTSILELLGLSEHMDGERFVAVEMSVVSSNNLIDY